MTRLKRCHVQGKIRFPTYWHAWRVHNKLNRKHYHLGGCVYRCNFCHDWHITHYDEPMKREDMIFFNRKPSKKELRSQRLRIKREKREKRPRSGEKLYPIFHTMRRIIPIIPNMQPEKLASKLSQGFGELKLFVGGTTYCALTMMHEAMVQLEKCKAYRNTAKRQLRQARTEWDRYERELKNPPEGCLRFFCLADMDAEYRRRYGDITDAEYFEFWTGTGGNMYVKCKPHIQALTYKYERYLQGHNIRDAKAYASAMAADALLQMAVIVFQTVSQEIQQDVPAITPSFSELAQPLNPERICKAFHRGIEIMFTNNLPGLTEEEDKNIQLTTNDISAMWGDPLLYMDMQQQTIEDYADDVFRTKGECKKLLRLNNEKRAMIEKEVMEQKVKQYQQQNN